jgi:hypothetical protein
MPYQAGDRLPGERASRIGHLDVIKSPLVQKICQNFRNPTIPAECRAIPWEPIPEGRTDLKYIFGVDGSIQVIRSDVSPYSTIAFIKTSMLKIDQHELSKIDKETPHPYMIRDILQESAIYHATVMPLENVGIEGMTNYHAVREIIFESFRDPSSDIEGEVLETLKWLAYKKWKGDEHSTTPFECPHCHNNNTILPYDADSGFCQFCGKKTFITDWLGFHQEMGEDSAPDGIATTYMNVHETLLLFTAVRYYWTKKKKILCECLFVKDGPLSIRAQYSKLVVPIRQFLAHARDAGYPVHIVGQEKSGRFFDHFQFIKKEAPDNSLFIPGDIYVKKQIQHRPVEGAPYGKDTNYGAKIFLKYNDYHSMVLNIPIGEFEANPQIENLIGYEEIFATLPKILSYRHEGALLPVELAHGIASLSTYPSAKILQLFSESRR